MITEVEDYGREIQNIVKMPLQDEYKQYYMIKKMVSTGYIFD